MPKKPDRDNDAIALDRPATFLRRERVVQRVGIGVLTLFVVAGGAGAFGNGPLADATITNGATTIRFERFARQTFRTNVDISVAGATATTVSVTMPRAFLDSVDVLEVRPADSLKSLGDDVVTFEVPTANGSATLSLHYEPKSFGILDADVIVAGQPPAHVRQIIFF